MGSCNFKVYIIMRFRLAKRTKAVRGRWYACTAGGWKDAETREFDSSIIKKTFAGRINPVLFLSNFSFLYMLFYVIV